jgi:zinc/manganese transport system permease protein
VASHELFHVVQVLAVPFLACAAMTGILGYLGLHVLKREIVFVDIALAQIVAVGAIAAHLLFGVHEGSPMTYVSAFGLAVAAAAFYSITRRRVLQISVEAVIGVSYAIAAAAALFLLGVAPDGHAHAQHMLAGSILWATRADVVVCSFAFLAVGLCFYIFRTPFGRISDDYDGAVRDGVRVVWWDFVFYTLLGVVITFAVEIGGVVVVFCLLIIPATIAVMVSGRATTRLLVAWTAGVTCSVLGLLFAHRLDFSVGPAVALLLGVGLVVAGAWRRLDAIPAAAATAVIAAAYVGALAAAPPVADVARDQRPEVTDSAAAHGLQARQPGARTDAVEPQADVVPGRDENTPDPKNRCDQVLQEIDKDSSSGARLALEFLGQDPPLFYRQQVVDKLEQALARSFDLDVTRPFADPDNQAAAEDLRNAIEGMN